MQKKNGITQFICGTEKGILDEIKTRKIQPLFEIINPKVDLPVQYRFQHKSSDIVRAIKDNNVTLFSEIATLGTIETIGNMGLDFNEIYKVLDNASAKFNPGRHCVDLVMFCGSGNDKYLLNGIRVTTASSPKQKDFLGQRALPGGGIDLFESPLDALVREGGVEESGLVFKFVHRYLEPSQLIIKTKDPNKNILATLRFGGLYSDPNPEVAGLSGGSSQVFIINTSVPPETFDGLLKSTSDLANVSFTPIAEVLKEPMAYQHTDMVKDACWVLGISI